MTEYDTSVIIQKGHTSDFLNHCIFLMTGFSDDIYFIVNCIQN